MRLRANGLSKSARYIERLHRLEHLLKIPFGISFENVVSFEEVHSTIDASFFPGYHWNLHKMQFTWVSIDHSLIFNRFRFIHIWMHDLHITRYDYIMTDHYMSGFDMFWCLQLKPRPTSIKTCICIGQCPSDIDVNVIVVFACDCEFVRVSVACRTNTHIAILLSFIMCFAL